MRHATVTLTLLSALAAGALVAAPSQVAAVAIALPPSPTTQARVTGFLSPSVDPVNAHLIYGLREPPSASGAGLAPFVVALGNPASGVTPFDLAVDDGLCTRSSCAFTILALDDTGSDSVLVGMGLGRAGDAIFAGESFSQVFGSAEQALADALRAGSESVLATFFLDDVGKAAGAGVSRRHRTLRESARTLRALVWREADRHTLTRRRCRHSHRRSTAADEPDARPCEALERLASAPPMRACPTGCVTVGPAAGRARRGSRGGVQSLA